MDWRRYIFAAVLLSVTKVHGNYTFNYHTAAQCKEHVCRHGYKYETFYRIYSDDRRQVKMDPNTLIEMHIAILGANNGHILLSTAANPNTTMPVYEIVVGGGGNKFTELRRNLRKNAKDTARTTAILSPVEFRPFYIRISKDGLIEFGKEGESPILRYYDVNPIPVEYFSFAAWAGVEAKFLYDCPVNGSNSTTDSKEVDPVMSNSDKLKATLLLDRMPHLPPGPMVDIRLGVKVTSVRYNPFTSKLVTGVAMVASWVDDSMAWSPDKFNNITRLTFRDGQIWRPTFFLANSHDQGAIDAESPGPTTMVNSGEATYYFQAELTTWCYEYAKTVNRWPHDDYRCSVVIMPWETHEKVKIEEISHLDEKMGIFADAASIIPNEWEIKWKQGVVEPDKWHTIFTPNDDNDQSDRFLINIKLKRKATAYNIVFYTPLTVLVLFVLISFWSEPLEMSRVWLYAGIAIVICMGLCYVDYLVPCHTVPTILILYVTVLSGVLIALLIQVLMMTSVANAMCKSSLVSSLLSARIFRMIFLLPAKKNASNYNMINEAYSQEEDEGGSIISPRNGNVEEMETDCEGSEREELACAIDKLLFVVYSVVFAVMLAMHF